MSHSTPKFYRKMAIGPKNVWLEPYGSIANIVRSDIGEGYCASEVRSDAVVRMQSNKHQLRVNGTIPQESEQKIVM